MNPTAWGSPPSTSTLGAGDHVRVLGSRRDWKIETISTCGRYAKLRRRVDSVNLKEIRYANISELKSIRETSG